MDDNKTWGKKNRNITNKIDLTVGSNDCPYGIPALETKSTIVRYDLIKLLIIPINSSN